MATNDPEKPETETATAQPTSGPGGEPELDPDRGAPRPVVDGARDLDPEALAVDRANARTSDRTDARDGVDGSDSIGRDPDGVGGKLPKPPAPRRALGKAGNPRRG